jgi:hypothetical protein
MIWNCKRPITPPMPAKVGHEVVLSPAEKKAPTAAAWPTGLVHLWLKRAPNTIVLPTARRPKRDKAK